MANLSKMMGRNSSTPAHSLPYLVYYLPYLEELRDTVAKKTQIAEAAVPHDHEASPNSIIMAEEDEVVTSPTDPYLKEDGKTVAKKSEIDNDSVSHHHEPSASNMATDGFLSLADRFPWVPYVLSALNEMRETASKKSLIIEKSGSLQQTSDPSIMRTKESVESAITEWEEITAAIYSSTESTASKALIEQLEYLATGLNLEPESFAEPQTVAEPESITKAKSVTEPEACSICLNEYADRHRIIRVTACEHMYCLDCYREWAKVGKNCTCPTCRGTTWQVDVGKWNFTEQTFEYKRTITRLPPIPKHSAYPEYDRPETPERFGGY